MFMKYLIKLENRETGMVAFTECPANMLLEELSIKIKSELHLPCNDEEGHSFMMKGKVYVPNRWSIHGVWGFPKDWFVTSPEAIQDTLNYPREQDIRNSRRYTLEQVFTSKGSVITYDQVNNIIRNGSYPQGVSVRCTLVDRIGA